MAQLLKVIAFEARGGPHDGGRFVVADHRMIVGSDPDCDFVLAEPDVAGEHASFKLSGTHVEVHDLGTHSGTFVNGARIAAPTLVSLGDEVKIGSTVLTEVVTEQEPAGEPAGAIHEAPAAIPPVPSAPRAAPQAPPPATPPKRGPRVGGPHGKRNLLIVGGVIGLLAAIVVGVIVATSGAGPLTMQQIITKDKPSTLMVVSRSKAVSPVTGTAGIFAGGSAWVYDASRGLVVTNAHVLQGADTFEVGYQESDLTAATVVAVDARDDIAVLHVSPGDLPGLKSLQRAPAGGAQQGAKAYVLGFPGNATSQTDFLRTPFQATDGTISAKGVQANVNTDAWGDPRNDNAALLLSNLYQTTAAINAGASGGPMVDDQGRLIGMNVASGKEAQHYAIPLSTLNSVVPQLAQGRSIGWLGIGVSALPSQVANAWKIDGGLIITSVVKDTPADQSGLSDYLAFASKSPFDYLVLGYVNGQQVTTMQAYVNAVSQLQSGQQAKVRVGRFSPNGYYHGYKEFKVTVP